MAVFLAGMQTSAGGPLPSAEAVPSSGHNLQHHSPCCQHKTCTTLSRTATHTKRDTYFVKTAHKNSWRSGVCLCKCTIHSTVDAGVGKQKCEGSATQPRTAQQSVHKGADLLRPPDAVQGVVQAVQSWWGGHCHPATIENARAGRRNDVMTARLSCSPHHDVDPCRCRVQSPPDRPCIQPPVLQLRTAHGMTAKPAQ